MAGSLSQSPSILVVGGGPAGLMAADRAVRRGVKVTLIERMPSLGRRFLMAGRGGLNLTHSEESEFFLTRYGAASSRIGALLAAFSQNDLRAFADELGAETFIGSSGRVFPKVMKASPLLRAWLARLERQGVVFRLRCSWEGFDAAGKAVLADDKGRESCSFDAVILACGGASWPRLGANGDWLRNVDALSLPVTELSASNVGIAVAWSAFLRDRFCGAPLKPLVLTIAGQSVRGEAVISARGLEGQAVYALNARYRDALACGESRITLDLAPHLDEEQLVVRLQKALSRKGITLGKALLSLRLSRAAMAILREGGILPHEARGLARRIKALHLQTGGLLGLERAISTAGGVSFAALDEHLMVRDRPGLFIAGEMLDFDAPTGGYLLQAAFSSGFVAGEGAARLAGLRSAPD